MSLAILNIGVGDTKLSFDPANPAGMSRSIQVQAMIAAKITRARLRYEGAQFDRLFVIEYLPGRAGVHANLRCMCTCGQKVEVMVTNIISGRTRSCGCLNDEARVANNTRHGGVGRSEYIVWRAMIRRCTDANHRGFRDYGGRGILICERWREFPNFLSDMGPRPSKEYSIDRYPNLDGNYEPGNCRWATRSQQARNRRNNHLISFNGLTLPLTDWSERTGLSESTIRARLRDYHYSAEDALTVPLYGRPR